MLIIASKGRMWNRSDKRPTRWCSLWYANSVCCKTAYAADHWSGCQIL